MQLIEIVTADETYEKVCQQAAAFAVSIDRLPLRTKSAPGFLVNRTLSPYMDEAMRLMEEGVAPVEIDRVAKKFGMPMGPVELADTVGLDVCLDVGEVLGQAFGGEPSQLLQSQVDRRRLGRKTNAGFYDYKKGKIIRNSGKGKPLPDSEICDRMVLRLLNEAVACWREQIVADSDLIDVAMVFGVGFAPFRGGPFNYARNRGVIEIISRLRELEVRLGGRFKADPGWQRITDE
jgi:3-hydroxyacyl-CoA dehydrogenase/enoyl-CoA hydratase/3-hydroxybutyryl-CoA epimerase